jgi:hypothetical protein
MSTLRVLQLQRFERLWWATFSALALMIVVEHICGSNVISNMSLITILVGLSSGSTCMSKVFISVC